MKRLIYLFSAIALLCGCEKFAETGDLAIKNPSSNIIDNLPEVIYAYTANSEDEESTRAYVDGNRVLWKNGDAILYCANDMLNTKYVFNGNDGSASAEFDKDNNVRGNTIGEVLYPGDVVAERVEFSFGAYPYSNFSTKYLQNGDNPRYFLFVDYPEVQTYTENSFSPDANIMIATGKNTSDNNLHFKSLCGFLVINLYGNCSIKSIKLTPARQNACLAGREKGYVYSDGKCLYPSLPGVDYQKDGWENPKNTITLDCSNGGNGVELSSNPNNPTEFWFAMPPQILTGGFTITITDCFDNVFEKKTTKDVIINRNEVQPMAALSLETLDPESQMFLYTRADGNKEPLTFETKPFDADIVKHYYDEYKQKFVIKFKSQPTLINENAFKGTDVTTISIPEGIKSIGKSAFEGSALTSLTLPKNVTWVSANAFSHCRSLATIYIEESDKRDQSISFNVSKYEDPEDSTKQIEAGPFLYSPLSQITLKREIKYSFNSDNLTYGLFHTDGSVRAGSVRVELDGHFWYIGKAMFHALNIEEITIPAVVTDINSDAFRGCEKLKTVTLNNSVVGDKYLGGELRGERMFQDCSELETVNYGGTFNSIDGSNGSIFKGCSKLKHIIVSGEVNHIPEDGFRGFNLASLTISGRVGTIGTAAFKDCDAMTSFVVTGTLNTIGTRAFEDSDKLATVSISNTVDKVCDYAFSDCDAVTTLAIPANTVGDYAYEDMDGLKTAILYGATVGKGVFYDSDALEDVTIAGDVNSIGNDAFYSCPSIKKVTFLPSPTATDLVLGYQTYGTAEEGPFKDSNLEEVIWNRNISYTLYNKGGLDEYDEGIFSQNSKLTNGNLTDGNLTTDVTIGEQVKKILPYTFAETAITTITLPKNYVTIGSYAFAKCNNLTTVYYYYGYAPTIQENAFYECSNTVTYSEIK